MPKSQNILVALSLAAGALVAACGGQPVPAMPTYEADVKPIMESRCVRCHGGGGNLNDDPDHGGVGANPMKAGTGTAPFDGFFNRLEDDCADGTALMCHGLLYYTSQGGPGQEARFLGYIQATDDAARMPPPPTPALSTRQIDVLVKWLDNPLP